MNITTACCHVHATHVPRLGAIECCHMGVHYLDGFPLPILALKNIPRMTKKSKNILKPWESNIFQNIKPFSMTYVKKFKKLNNL